MPESRLPPDGTYRISGEEAQALLDEAGVDPEEVQELISQSDEFLLTFTTDELGERRCKVEPAK